MQAPLYLLLITHAGPRFPGSTVDLQEQEEQEPVGSCYSSNEPLASGISPVSRSILTGTT